MGDVSNKLLMMRAHGLVDAQFNGVIDAMRLWRAATIKLQAAIINDAEAEGRELTDDEHKRLDDLAAEFTHILHVTRALYLDTDSLCISGPLMNLGGERVS